MQLRPKKEDRIELLIVRFFFVCPFSILTSQSQLSGKKQALLKYSSCKQLSAEKMNILAYCWKTGSSKSWNSNANKAHHRVLPKSICRPRCLVLLTKHGSRKKSNINDRIKVSTLSCQSCQCVWSRWSLSPPPKTKFLATSITTKPPPPFYLQHRHRHKSPTGSI